MDEVLESDVRTVERIFKGEMHPAMVDAIGLLARLRKEHDQLEAENAWLRQRIAEEDERLSHG